MASQLFDGLLDQWQDAKKLVFVAETDIAISNPSDSFGFVDITTGGLPVNEVRTATVIGPKARPVGMKMQAGEELYFGGSGAKIFVMGV